MAIKPVNAPSTVGFTLGVMQWTVQGHGARTARAVAVLERIARRFIPCAGYALTVGTCRTQQNGKYCSMLLEENRRQERYSSPPTDGMTTKEKMAMVMMLSGSRRCLLATWMSMGVTATRATARSSGVLQSTIATSRTTWNWTTTAAIRACTATVITSGFQSVVSRTKLRPCFSSGRCASARCSRTSGRIRRSPCRARVRGGLAPRQTRG